VIEMQFVAFTLRSEPTVKNWQDLFKYDVGIVTGMKIVETNLAGHPHLTSVVTPYQLFQLLVTGRVDYVVFSYWNGLAYAHRFNLQDHIQIAQPPLAVKDMFIYVNDRYEAFIPELAATLANLKADGTYQQLFDATLGRLQQQFAPN
jgi:polar amino acid transport system substrate-binding protein